MISPNYHYAIRGTWEGQADEPAAIGARFLEAADSLSDIDPLFADWQVYRNHRLEEDELPRQIPLSEARKDIAKIVEGGVVRDDFDEPEPYFGYNVGATAGQRGPRIVRFRVQKGDWALEFGEYDIVSDLSLVSYPLFKAALLAINSAWRSPWAYAQAHNKRSTMVAADIAPGVPGFRVDTALQVPIDPTFPKSAFLVPWIVYFSAKYVASIKTGSGILSEQTADGGLLLSATTDRLDPMNPGHVRNARILAETLIAIYGYSKNTDHH